jgi:hypothetical protein
MATDIQVRGVNEELAAAAKAQAMATNRSLSAYVRDLIRVDLARSEAQRRNQRVLEELAADPDRPRVSRDSAAAALTEALRDLDAR